jgi:hypothetical protein
MTVGFQMFEWTVQMTIIRQQHYFQVIWNCAPGLFADYERNFVAAEDTAWQPEHDYIGNPPAAGSLANMKFTCSSQAAN